MFLEQSPARIQNNPRESSQSEMLDLLVRIPEKLGVFWNCPNGLSREPPRIPLTSSPRRETHPGPTVRMNRETISKLLSRNKKAKNRKRK